MPAQQEPSVHYQDSWEKFSEKSNVHSSDKMSQSAAAPNAPDVNQNELEMRQCLGYFQQTESVEKLPSVDPVVPQYSLQTQSEPLKDSSSVYKTPNYKKAKAKPKAKYETKHQSEDISEHETKMEQKYGTKLSIRKDVVNKTLFRALKRYYTELFLKNYELDTKESSESYLHKIKEFSYRLLLNRLEELCFHGLTIDKVEKFLAIVISPNHVKPTLKDPEDIALHKEYYSCIYQYSHKKLANMLLNPVCGHLFTDFVTSGNLTKFISTCSTMSQNFDVYDKAGKSFLEIIKGKTKKPGKGFMGVKAYTQAV